MATTHRNSDRIEYDEDDSRMTATVETHPDPITATLEHGHPEEPATAPFDDVERSSGVYTLTVTRPETGESFTLPYTVGPAMAGDVDPIRALNSAARDATMALDELAATSWDVEGCGPPDPAERPLSSFVDGPIAEAFSRYSEEYHHDQDGARALRVFAACLAVGQAFHDLGYAYSNVRKIEEYTRD